MLQLGSRGSRTVRNHHICAACSTSLLRAPGALSGHPSNQHERPYGTTKTPDTNGNSRKPIAKKEYEKRTHKGRIRLWRETLDTLKNLQAKISATATPDGDSAAARESEPRESAAGDASAVVAEAQHGGTPAETGDGPKAGEDGQQLPPERSQRLLEGALNVLKQVLEVQLETTKLKHAQRVQKLNKRERKSQESLKQENTDEQDGEKKPVRTRAAAAEKERKEKAVTAKSEFIRRLPSGPKQAVSRKSLSETSTPEISVQRLDSAELRFKAVDKLQPPVPRVQYGLDRVLFNPGVYHLQDPRSRVYNFDPYLASIMPIQEFDFNALKEYVTSSKDTTLISIAASQKKKYTGSTSSMTAMLSHFHFLLSAWRPINAAHTSRSFTPESTNFTRITRAPAAAFLHWKEGVYAIDADKQFDTANILSMLGKSMEKLLTLRKEEYEKYRVRNSSQLTEADRNAAESYHYSTLGDFMMRSQLDAHDRRLPGTGMFDLKTRAVVSVRMGAKDFQKGMDYEIRARFGQFESFEREYFDMIRSAFLKYSLQVRMGRMDGIFVAFHNTQRIFGFQYVSINEMDEALHGTAIRALGDKEFRLSLGLLNEVLNRASTKFPGRSLRIHIETRESKTTPFMYIFATPVTEEGINEVQNSNKASIEAFEREILGLEHADIAEARVDEAERQIEEEEEEEEEEEDEGGEEGLKEYDDAEEDEDSLDVWEDMRSVVQETMENETLGITSIREELESALDQSGLLKGTSQEQARQYVDALLEVITSVAAEGAQSNSAGDGTGVIPPDNHSPPVETSDVESEVVSRNGNDTVEDTDKDQEQGAFEEDVATREPEQDQQQGNDIGKAEGSSDPSPSDNPSLKDLIIKLAGQLEASSIEGKDAFEGADDQSDQEAISDQAKLQEFGRILTEMITSSKGARDSDEEVPTISRGVISSDGTESGDAALVSDIEQRLESHRARSQSAGESAKPKDTPQATEESPTELYGMILTIRNKVNGKYVTRPSNLTKKCSWVVEYSIEEIEERRAKQVYQAVKKRRETLMTNQDQRQGAWGGEFREKLYELSKKGRAFRERETQIAKQRPLHVVGMSKPKKWEDVFGDMSKA
ncbi:hypothetical protein NKR23_g5159 [Pleurostoma richardsiae]|uniref:Uncharacterized protein n=1 Tax=Pleurostoma richardsiae TaxID=41990 RepID=A0AA38VF55_9PEZI|nr:hypothetical protein NKR23_g5159 [Pleurostoma richardsiae]